MKTSKELDALTPDEVRAVRKMVAEVEHDLRTTGRYEYLPGEGQTVDPEYTERVVVEVAKRAKDAQHRVSRPSDGLAVERKK